MSADLLKMPIADLIRKGLLVEAMRARDKQLAHIEEDNRKYVSKRPVGRLQVIKDSMDDTLNPVDGKHYDSKCQYYRKLKETGHHVYEGKPTGKKVLDRGDHNVFNELKQAAQMHGFI